MNKFMKQAILFLISSAVLLMPFQCLAASASDSEKKLTITAEIFPAYDWVTEITKNVYDASEIHLLLSNGVDLHSYQPTADDIMQIADSDVLIYVGGESDGWIEDALAEAENPDRIVINLMELLGDSVKEEAESIQEEHGHDEDEIEYDEHVWLSLRNAEIIAAELAESFASLDPAHAGLYNENLTAYVSQLDSLDSAYQEVCSNAAFDTVLFADRFPFRYLMDDYDLNYFAAFAGCSAETEASFETLSILIEKINEYRFPAVLVIEGADYKIANTIVANTDTPEIPVLEMNSMQATTLEDYDNGASYLSISASNLEILKQALGYSS